MLHQAAHHRSALAALAVLARRQRSPRAKALVLVADWLLDVLVALELPVDAAVAAGQSAYQHLAKQPLSTQACDQYITEMARVGHLLGAVDLPLTYAATKAELLAYADALSFDARAQEILQIIQAYPVDVLDKPWMALVLKCAFDVMPPNSAHNFVNLMRDLQTIRRAL